MGKSKCESTVGKRRCRRSPIKNTGCCHSHTRVKSKEIRPAIINTLVNVLTDEEVGEGRKYCKRCHQSSHINVLTEENMCVACVYKLERFIKEFHKEELRKKEEAAKKLELE
jgi:hypothetical protein